MTTGTASARMSSSRASGTARMPRMNNGTVPKEKEKKFLLTLVADLLLPRPPRQPKKASQ